MRSGVLPSSPRSDCDPTLMAQVFQNLLGNALKYSRGRVGPRWDRGAIRQDIAASTSSRATLAKPVAKSASP